VAQATKKYRDEVTPYKLLISSFTINNFRVCVSHQKRGVPIYRDFWRPCEEATPDLSGKQSVP
jgi:hypothetical protein